MCVITVKPKNKKIEPDDLLNMWYSNPDGAGLAIIHGSQSEIIKGFFCPDDLLKVVNKHTDKTVVVHFRLATCGLIDDKMTHPFIISSDLSECTATEIKTDKPVLIHNGIISGYGNKEISDTAEFTHKVLSKLDNIADMRKILQLTGCKYTLIHAGRVKFIGQFTKFKGLYVSNTHFDFKNYNKWGFDNEDSMFAGKKCNSSKYKRNKYSFLS